MEMKDAMVVGHFGLWNTLLLMVLKLKHNTHMIPKMDKMVNANTIKHMLKVSTQRMPMFQLTIKEIQEC